MAVQVEIWERYLVDRFWKENAFLKNSTMSDTGNLIQGKIVHIQQPGAKPVVVKNRNYFPAAAVRRVDSDVLYALDVYTTDPTHIFEADKQEISYDKMDSVMGDHVNTITETIADDLLIKWLSGIPYSTVYQVTGTPVAATVNGQSGTRKTMTVNDVKKLSLKFNLDGVPKNDRYMLLDANHYDQLIGDMTINQSRDFSEHLDVANGVVGKLFGFNIMMRASVAMASYYHSVNVLGQAVSYNDNVVSMAWQKRALAQVMGEVKMFQDTDNPLYYGDIYSGLIRMGGRRRREDNLGVVAIVAAP